MPYYQGDYYRGDYYQGGILDVLKTIGKGAIGVASSIIPGGAVVRGAATAASRLLAGGGPAPATVPTVTPRITTIAAPAFGTQGVIGVPGKPDIRKQLGVKRRRRMNVANPKALRRAIRREAGFVKLARRALKGTAYTIVTKGSRRKRMTIKEAGPGGVTVQ